STLPSDPASRRRPCVSLALHHHQVGQGTCTPKLLRMLGAPKKNPNERFGFNPPKEEVEETAEVAELLQPMGSII
ncbi:hypothetical protein, partial [Paraburkholderia madseniana]|uniref:hypothetical protein n=1 Tax=Paraburkholderia madseniana TaxID=2599607 RepID=UPI001C130EDB